MVKWSKGASERTAKRTLLITHLRHYFWLLVLCMVLLNIQALEGLTHAWLRESFTSWDQITLDKRKKGHTTSAINIQRYARKEQDVCAHFSFFVTRRQLPELFMKCTGGNVRIPWKFSSIPDRRWTTIWCGKKLEEFLSTFSLSTMADFAPCTYTSGTSAR